MPADALVPTTADAPAACRPRSDVGIGQRGRVSSVLPSQFPSLERTFDSRILVGMWYKPNVAARRRGLAMICSCRIFISSRSALRSLAGKGKGRPRMRRREVGGRKRRGGRKEGRDRGREGGREQQEFFATELTLLLRDRSTLRAWKKFVHLSIELSIIHSFSYPKPKV